MTASIRECSCSFSRMLRTWFLTVFSLMKSRGHIAVVHALGDQPEHLELALGQPRGHHLLAVGRAISLNSSISLTAIDGLISDWPSATTRTACATSSIEESLSR